MDLTVVKNATCTFCGCVCDDIELHADAERITKTKHACILGESWFKNHTAERLYPDALIDGKPATVDDAVEAAAEYLYRANMPLVYGLSNVTCEAQREAVSLAEKIGAVIDKDPSIRPYLFVRRSIWNTSHPKPTTTATARLGWPA